MPQKMIVGTEWLIDAYECEPAKLRDLAAIQAVFDAVIRDLGLKVVGDPQWHKFGGEGGVTGLTMLTESHLACHTYPEFRTATFNLYCCQSRPEWDWNGKLSAMIGAGVVNVTRFVRGRDIVVVPQDPITLSIGGEF